MLTAEKSILGPEFAHPEQGGEWISLCFLHSFPQCECLYWFKYVIECSPFSFPDITSDSILRKLRNLLDYSKFQIHLSPEPGKFTAVEALRLLLAHFQSPSDIYELTARYDCSQSAISKLINELTEYLDNTWRHLLESWSMNPTISSEQMAIYSSALVQHGAPLDSVWAFVDCTIQAMCCPSQFQ
ncbi:hypothetical protein GYMLUDRAFT_179931 [Collybiopsis luxurians FD-317 M1]|uniref:Uncharacterized protein n=1 Tax=Collybiopsis luxurians FD-317 M1 TaxID=944289 RepID=A0A0D0BSP6_9AGAR|nr:hypothetical protein GYMLUDRAFT_179931 [Collybiopsis luxurians FD-317 M1]